ncbi:MAG: shikimate kinase [Bacteroidales bacterium]|nr:shikimate kinase [Bacteroidales bacterium]
MRIYLIGYMYSGKTTVGRKLADALGYDFLDLDQAIETRYHTTLPLFFKRYGEPMFRQVEMQMLHDTSRMDNVVISTGGGTPCFSDNMQWINDNGTSIYLRLTEESICQRMECSRKCRPTVMALPPEERKQFIHDQLSARLPIYQQARHTIVADGMDTKDIISTILQAINQ